MCICLNPLHTTLAVFDCLPDSELISAQMEDSLFKRLAEIISYQDGFHEVITL